MEIKSYRKGYRHGVLDIAELIEYAIDEEEMQDELSESEYWMMRGLKRAHKIIMEHLEDYDNFVRESEGK